MDRCDRLGAIGALCAWLCVSTLGLAQNVSTTEKVGDDGVTYRETRWTYPRVVTEWKKEQRNQTSYQERVTTEVKKIDQPYYHPVTEYRWEPVMQGRWNPFVQPYYQYKLTPYTRWEIRNHVVDVPIAKREVIPSNQTVEVWVPNQRSVQEEYVSRVPVGVRSNGTAVARRDPVKLETPPKTE
jgi:hypothetical protein